MTYRAAIALLLAALAGPPAHAGSLPVPAFEVIDRLNPVDPLPERETRWNHPGITLTSVTYSTLPGYRPLRLDLYRPEGVTAARPLVVFIHGGGWAFGNPRAGAAFRDFPAILASLAQQGFVVAAIEYRLAGEAVLPAPNEDLSAALDFLRRNAERLGIDAKRIALWGMSAGAQVAALDAVTCGPGRCVRGFVGWFGAYDLAAHLQQAGDVGNLVRALGCGSNPCAGAVLAAASPSERVTTGAPPALLLHGLDDTNVSPQQSQAFAQRLREAGNAVDLVLLPGLKHGFVGADASATQHGLQRALSATFDFFERVLRPATPAP
jgi:acetyl esterase/lipase